MSFLKGAAIGLALAALAGTAQAAWPEDRPINVIVAYAPGGSTDVAARAFLPFIEKYLEGAQFAVINRPGAGGEVGTTELATATPDGYTIGFLNSPSFLQKPYERDTRYTKDSFTYIANLVYDPGAYAVKADDEIKTLDDYIAWAKENPRRMTVATAGVGTDDHLTLSQFNNMADIQLTLVPFAGDAPSIQAVLGGHVKSVGLNLSPYMNWVKEGELRVLAIASDKRVDMAPDIPTFQEQGLDLVGGSARGLGGPAGMPGDVVDKLSAAIEKAVKDPEFVAQSEKQYVPLRYMNSEEYRSFIDQQDAMVKAQWEKDPWKK